MIELAFLKDLMLIKQVHQKSVICIKMLYYDRIDVFEGIDINKTSASKECDMYATTGIF